MLELNLPPFDKKITKKDDKPFILDVIRRQHVALTPEEWVRQHFVHFLINHKGYPPSLMANEVQLKLNGMSRRCDTVVYDRMLTPRVIIEYKAPTVDITQKVFDQICRYNLVLQVDYLIVSNGLAHYCCQLDYATRSYRFLRDIPEYTSIIEDHGEILK
ncbi:MAG: type I restriction enzyme HsdR N-terminal domain-containing protein [Bacteroidaceae bacterium]|nr:type I restriction enzyme HsdR N-terminal domain-containing protein [Bacteroidaceae bacterium]